MTYSIVESA